MSLVFRRYLASSTRVIPNCPSPEYTTECTYCEIPKFSQPIDFDKNLNGTKSVPWKHMLILSHGITNFDEMPSKIELIPNQLSTEISMLKRGLLSPFHPIMVSNILLNNHQQLLDKFNLGSNEQLVYLYPDRKIIRFDMSQAGNFISKYLVPKEIEPVYNPFKKEVTRAVVPMEFDDSNFKETAISKELVLICGHTQRDDRCGKLAPLLRNEFEHVFEREGLDIEIGLVSHIGGHAYAGNVIYFPKKGESVWYGRVFPDKVQGIVKETIMKGNIIKELYRGDIQ